MEKIIQLEDNDDITSIRSRIDFILPQLTRESVQTTGEAARPRLLLMVPRKNKALHSLVNMKLLARTVQSRAVDVAIVSGSPTARDYAREAGLKVFGSLQSAKRAGWVTRQAPVTPPDSTLPPVAPPPAQPEAAPASRSNGQRQRQKKKKYVVVAGDKRSGSIKYLAQQLGMLILIVILAFALVIGFVGLLPRATVTMTPVSQPVEAELIVRADPEAESVNFSELTFPARKTQVELRLSGEIETVKTELSPVGQATGSVIFINRTEEPQTIPISTTVAATAGEPMEFVTVVTATIPAGIGAVATPTPIIATEPGPRGNVGVGQINQFVDPRFGLAARVINEQPTGGGALAPAKIVTEDDKPRLQEHLQARIREEGVAQLEAALGEQEFIPPDSIQVIVLDVKYREFSGDVSDVFGGEMQGVVRATVVGGYNANRLALAALEAQVPPGYELDIEGLRFGAGEVLGIEEGVVAFRIFASGQAIPVIDDRAVAEEIAWLSIGEAQELLSQQYELISVPGVDLQPDWLVQWLGRLPYSPLRIEVVINKPVSMMAEGN